MHGLAEEQVAFVPSQLMPHSDISLPSSSQHRSPVVNVASFPCDASDAVEDEEKPPGDLASPSDVTVGEDGTDEGMGDEEEEEEEEEGEVDEEEEEEGEGRVEVGLKQKLLVVVSGQAYLL